MNNNHINLKPTDRTARSGAARQVRSGGVGRGSSLTNAATPLATSISLHPNPSTLPASQRKTLKVSANHFEPRAHPAGNVPNVASNPSTLPVTHGKTQKPHGNKSEPRAHPAGNVHNVATTSSTLPVTH